MRGAPAACRGGGGGGGLCGRGACAGAVQRSMHSRANAVAAPKTLDTVAAQHAAAAPGLRRGVRVGGWAFRVLKP